MGYLNIYNADMAVFKCQRTNFIIIILTVT